jgi:plastocyanin
LVAGRPKEDIVKNRLRLLAAVVLVMVAVLALVALPGCSSGTSSSGGSGGTSSGGGSTGGSTAAGATAVTIANFAFSPASVTIKVGDSVTWTNNDSATHAVVGDGGISSGDLTQGKTYTKKFDTAGSFAYRCSIHPSMTGTVVVK